MILILKHIIPKNYTGLAIYPFIFIKNKSLSDNETLINHEKIHLKQQLELLWVFFFVWYIVEFVIHLMRYRNWNKAYHNISFEREAYHNESDLDYLKYRKTLDFLKYLK